MRNAAVSALALLASCSGMGNAPSDASIASDATLTVPVDADTTDTDGDGFFDAVDVCPTIPDPAQVDLDGDGVGWLCDPVDSKVVSHPGISTDFQLAVHGLTAGAAFRYQCATGTCKNVVLTVGPSGVNLADSSTASWLTSGASWGWGLHENHVLWSFVGGGMGEIDAATGTFTPRYDGTLQGSLELGTNRLEHGALTILPSDSPTEGYTLLEPRSNGQLFIISQTLLDYGVNVVAGGEPSSLLFSKRLPGSASLQRYKPGAAASETVVVNGVPLDAAWDITTIVTPQSRLIGLCVDQANVRYFVSIDDDDAPGAVLPLSSCDYGGETHDHRLRVIVGEFTGVAYILDGTVQTLAAVGYNVEVFGRGLPAAIRSEDGQLNQTVHAIDTAGTAHVVASVVKEAIVSTEGDTVHVLAKRNNDRVLFRYKNGTSSEVTLPAFTATQEQIQLFTTNEGAALINTPDGALAVSSQTMATTTLPLTDLRGFVRDGVSLFSATSTSVGSEPALFHYQESAGAPQYTALTPEADGLYAYPLDLPDGTRTKWLAVSTLSGCTIVRPTVSGTVALVGDGACRSGAAIDGTTNDGNVLFHTYGGGTEELFLLDGDALTRVARSTTQIQLVHAAWDRAKVMGWSGTDSTNNRFVCLGTHPERCWTPPPALRRWDAPVVGQPDALHVVYLEQMSGAVKFTSIKAMGPGTRPQPL